MKWFSAGLATVILAAGGCMTQEERRTQAFIDRHVQTVAPLQAAANLTMYAAEVSGSKEDFDKLKQLRLEIHDVYANRDDFDFLARMKASHKVHDLRLARQLDKLYLAYQQSVMDPRLLKAIIELETAITEKYNNYRGRIDGNEVTMTEIYRIMTAEPDAALRRKAWLASKEIGNVVVDDYLRLVKTRNESVRAIGYPNYHTCALAAGEQSVEDVDKIFAELDALTAAPYAKLKAELDAILAAGYGIAVKDLRPWHYHDPFFQRTPLVYELNLDDYYAKRDVVRLSEEYYAGVGLPVGDILARGDLYDKPGKNPHAFAADIDRHGDVRILANAANDERWMETMLHELGHAVYSKHHDPAEPYLLREPAHAFTTEAAAMFFGRLSRNAAWMQAMLGLTDSERAAVEKVAFKYLQFQQVLFARWAMVMYNFEKAVYADPDRDLNTLWWDLVEKYQLVHRPEGKPDAGWASKLHFTVAPCYYHNYMLGELLASQWHHYAVKEILGRDSDAGVGYVGDERIGDYFRTRVFGPGAVYPWNEMIRRSTGECLTPRHFAEQFIK
jgi:peptidyl-dipeptidase A